MRAQAVFAGTPRKAGMYESFYLRVLAPDEPVGVWVRYTVHKRPGAKARGSVWCTVFDASRGRPWMHKCTSEELSAPRDGWIAIGPSRLGDGYAEGECGGARWSLRIEAGEPELRHLPSGWMYRAPLPRTKLTSPSPSARFGGTLALPDGRTLELDGWRGMVGHNWGAEHAERWIWLHGVGFEEDESAWLDVALGRIEVAGRLTPWVANGALGIAGERYRIGGLRARGLRVQESTEGCELSMPGPKGLRVEATVEVPRASSAGWRYADPDGGEHEVANCSVARVELEVGLPGGRGARRRTSAHGGAYELGMRAGESHGVPIAPFADG
ncbi:MAG TPA: hypothetical protein VG053_04105 [Solirubrobacteraceae bacterium]|jgi:hypothetical protein|nr:hypothetical protein [Solirubrobacteraceae bacterium]